MSVARVRLTSSGFEFLEGLPPDLGLPPGEEALVEIRVLPSADDIRNKAKYHCWRKIGDAVGVKPPVWNGEVWTALLPVKGRDGIYGKLTLTAEGDVIPERSSSKQDVLEALEAEDATG